MISRGHAIFMLLRMRKPNGDQRRPPKPIVTGIRRHPHALSIDQYLPDGVGTESLLRCEALAWSRFERDGRGPSFHMLKPLHTLARHRPKGAIRSESKISELRCFVPFSRLRERRQAASNRARYLTHNPAESLVVREPNRAIRRFVEIGITG